ncbi:putative glucose dehydrogenase [Sesbania bispinosa]|nr:putative glucose dehydrogenase [Sesbania bispinosa]
MGPLPLAAAVSNKRPSSAPLVSLQSTRPQLLPRSPPHNVTTPATIPVVLVLGLVVFPYHRSTARRQQLSSTSKAKSWSCAVRHFASSSSRGHTSLSLVRRVAAPLSHVTSRSTFWP